ncbi:hypothetical protein ACAW63_10920 [Pseudomonas sp. QE6]|uniref:hypothetical protein n=1 Tax=Pseudomonas sp. QE6 TaxID=3242491 RepID=UPI00352898F1
MANHNSRTVGRQFLGGLQGSFSAQIGAWAAKSKEDMEELFQEVVVRLADELIQRSPVGNPDIWAVNSTATQYNKAVIEHNQALRSNPANLTKNRRLKPGLKVNDSMDVYRPAGYVGGHFRRNWQFGIDSPPTGEIEGVDPSGMDTLSAVRLGAKGLEIGQTAYLVNNTPYSIPLEYGHSKQAPHGIVRITVLLFDRIVLEEAAQIANR